MASLSSAISYGALEEMLRGASSVTDPVLQVVESKRIRDGRLRVKLWDAVEQYDYCMISKQASEEIGNHVEPNCLVKIRNFNLYEADDKIVIAVTECRVSASASEVGSDLVRLIRTPKRGATSAMQSPNTTPTKRPRPTQQASSPATSCVRLIDSLVPHQNRCFIRARVSNKSEIISWRNENGGGTLFSFEVFDRSGEITIKAFNLQCEKYYHVIERGKVYFFHGFQCSPVKKKWKTNDHLYSLTLGMFSSVELCVEPCDDIPNVTYNFVPISEIESVCADQKVDICAIMSSVGATETLNRKSDGKPLSKRDVYIVDDSRKMLKLTVWHGATNRVNRIDNPVLLIQRAEVQNYNGRVSVSTKCAIEINPDMHIARRLEAWWANGGSDEDFEVVGSLDETFNLDQEYVDFFVMSKISKNFQMFSGKPLYLWNRATITCFNREMSAYKGCLDDHCSKKVQEQSDGGYFCEKCSTYSQHFEWRFLLDMTLSDATGELRCRAFNQEAERILGVTARTFGDYIEKDIDEMDRVLSAATFKTFHFRFRGQESSYRGSRFQFTVAEVVEVTHVEDCRHFIDDVELLEEFL